MKPGTNAYGNCGCLGGTTRGYNATGLGFEVNLFKLGDWRQRGLGSIQETLLTSALDRQSERERRAHEAQLRRETLAQEEAARAQRSEERAAALEAVKAANKQIAHIQGRTLVESGSQLRSTLNRTTLTAILALGVIGASVAMKNRGKRDSRKGRKRRRSRRSRA